MFAVSFAWLFSLPEPFVPDISDAKDYISDAISIGIIAFAYSISVALFVSRKEGYEIDANQVSIKVFYLFRIM